MNFPKVSRTTLLAQISVRENLRKILKAGIKNQAVCQNPKHSHILATNEACGQKRSV